MALLTDDCDINEVYMRTYIGGNGDYYLELIYDEGGLKNKKTIRISTSGGNAPTNVKIAIAYLHKALEENKLNEHI